MGPSSGSYIVAENPRGLHRANQTSPPSSDSNETDEMATVGRRAIHGLHHRRVSAGVHCVIKINMSETSHEYMSYTSDHVTVITYSTLMTMLHEVQSHARKTAHVKI